MRQAIVLAGGVLIAACVAAADPGDALREAARAGDLAAVKSLLDAGTPADAPGRNQVTALRLAAEKGHLPVVELLVARGADVDAVETFFQTSVLAAALGADQRPVALWLLAHGATDRVGALGWAVEKEDLELAGAAAAGTELEPLDLAALRVAAAEKSEEVRLLVGRLEATAKPLPSFVHDTERLAAVAGRYEGRDGHTLSVVAVEGAVDVVVDGGEPKRLVAVRDRVFETPARDLRLEVQGRAGLVEWAGLLAANGESSFYSAAGSSAISEVALGTVDENQPAVRTADRPWRQFRGPGASGNGDGQGVPRSWDRASGHNVRFATPVPGIALASPIVDHGRIFVATAVSSKGDATFQTGLYGAGTSVDDVSEHSFRLLALDAGNGAVLWDREVAKVAPTVRRHLKSSLANSTPVTDGERVVVLFGMVGVLAAYDRDGEALWRRDIGVLEANDPQSGTAEWGHASSPIVWNGLVIVQADRRRDSFLAAYRISTGEEVWRVARDEPSTWSTPTIASGPAGDELVANGTTIRGYDPATGGLLWHLSPSSEVVVATPVAGEKVVYVTAGYPPVRPVYAIRAGSRGDLSLPAGASSSEAIAWSHPRGGTYLPTPILYRGHLVTLNNNGILTIYRADTGVEVHKARVGPSGTSFSASPVAADGRLLLASEDGVIYVLRGEPGWEQLATYEMGEVVMATPAIAEGLLVIRTLGHVVGLAAPAEIEPPVEVAGGP